MENKINTKSSGILFKDESYQIQGAVFEVYKEIGCGFLEAVYQECLTREFSSRNIPFICQPELKIQYKGNIIPVMYRPDFICYDKIIVEIKAINETGDEHRAQILNYLKATGYRLGLLVNFGHYPKATVERLIL